MQIIKDVYMMKCTKRSHVYLVKAQENILIDTGFPGLAEKIIDEIKSLGVDPKSIKHILLTHHDVDHIGNAKLLQQITGASLWVSKEDLPYISGKLNRTGVKKIVQTLIKHENPLVDNTYLLDQHFGNISVIKTPGHTPGHVIFAYKNVLFTGDLFKIKDGNIKSMAKYMNSNQSQLENSIGRLKLLEFEWICPAHGLPTKRDDKWEAFISRY